MGDASGPACTCPASLCMAQWRDNMWAIALHVL